MSIPSLTPAALLHAWEHVRENHGCAGVDGVTIERFADSIDAELNAVRSRVLSGHYRPLPLLPITVQKKPNSSATRTLLVPTVRDRVLQTAVGRQLGQTFEDEFLDSSFAYRPHRSVQSAVARIRYLHGHGYKYIAEADIDSFFDRIDHDLLRQRLETRIEEPLVCDLLTAWIEGFVWDGHGVRPIRSGVAQGSPISPLLANFFLSDLDLSLEEAGLKVIRYADDFLILSRQGGESEKGLEIARDRLEELHLALKAEKTVIGTFEEGFRFLGAFFLGEDVWIPFDRHQQHRRVLHVPRPMPRALVERWLEPPPMTAMGQALTAARHRPILVSKSNSIPESDDMAFLYLTEQGSVLRKIGNRLVVEKEGTILDTPYHKLEAVLVFGNVQITTQAMAELLEDGISVSLLSREGALRGA